MWKKKKIADLRHCISEMCHMHPVALPYKVLKMQRPKRLKLQTWAFKGNIGRRMKNAKKEED